jgi:hypothetical protein
MCWLQFGRRAHAYCFLHTRFTPQFLPSLSSPLTSPSFITAKSIFVIKQALTADKTIADLHAT